MRKSTTLLGGAVIFGIVALIACVSDAPTNGEGNDDGGGGGTDAQSGGGDGSSGGGDACTPNCGSACVDLTSDKDNCGACGHSCMGGQCGGSKCIAAQVFAGTGTDATVTGVAGLAIDGANIFWQSPLPFRPGLKPQVPATLYQCANAVPCAVPDVYFQTTDEIDAMRAGGAGTLFLANQSEGEVMRIGTDGVDGGGATTACPAGNPCAVATQALGTATIALDSANVYIGSNGNGTNGSGLFRGAAFGAGVISTLMNASISGGPAATAVTVDPANGYVYAAFSNGSIYVYETTASSSAADISIPSQTAVGQMTVAHGNVFWTRTDTGDVMSIPVCLGTFCNNHTVPTVSVFANVANTLALTSDATNLYWSAGSDVYACPLTGCAGAPTKIGSGTARIDTFAVDDKAIYWGDDSGSIWKLAK